MKDIPLGATAYFDFITSSPTTAAVTDADSTPTFEVFEENTDTDIGIGGNATKRTSKTGNYRISVVASSGNGFELGKTYNVIGSATVGGTAGKAVIGQFRVVAAENVAGYPVADVQKWIGGTIPAVNVTGVPLVDAKYVTGTLQTAGDIYAINTAIAGYIDTEVAAIKAKTDNLPASPAATSDIPTANQNADALLDRANGIETGWTFRQVMRLVSSALAGKVSGAASTTVTFRDITDTKNRIVATVDSDGNRSAITTDVT